jgi:hypothetical protein
MFKNIFKHILTTIVGAFTGLPLIVGGIQTHDVKTLITGTGLFLVGLLSKDHNKQ